MARYVNPASDATGRKMQPRRPSPADLFGPPSLPYSAEFYEKSRYVPVSPGPTLEEMRSHEQLRQQQNRQEVNLQGGGGSNTLAGGLTIPESANIDKVDARLVAIAREAASIFPYEVRITPHGGANARKTGTPNHPGGYALDYQIQDPLTGKWLDNFRNPETFRVYEQYAQTMRQVQLQKYPELTDSLRYGGYFGDVAADQMHIDITPGAPKPVRGTWEGGLGRNADGTPILNDKGNPIKLGRMARAVSVGMGQGPVELPPAAQSAIASLADPGGGTLTPGVRPGAEAYAPFLPPPSPGQTAISDLISPPSTTSDRDKLAGVMLAEARGEGREGRLGVGNVVLNRQAASGNRFPKTIDEVINNEFAKPLGPNDVSPDEWAETTQEAAQLLNGAIPDNTGGAVYFANTATSKPSAYAEIANSGPVSTTIGNHTFHTDAKIGAVSRGTGDLTADQIDELTRTDAAGNYTNPLVAPPPARRPGPGGALGVDLGMQPAGMPPPPSRPGTFDWLGGGAPDAGSVPTPGISPLRPALGGPGDRRPQPPNPMMRPAGGPPPYPAASMANMPAMVGMPPSASPGGVGAFSPPAAPSDLVPFLPPPAAAAATANAPPLERANRIAGGQGGPVIPISPDEMRRSLANAGANTEMSLGLGGLGTPETAMSLARTYPPPLSGMDERMDRAFSQAQSRGLARDLGFNRRQMEGYTQPPPSAASMANMPGMVGGGPRPDFAAANPSVMLPPSWSPVTSFPTATPDFDFAAGPGPTFTPPSLSGGGGSDALAAGNASPLSPPPPALMPPALMPSGDPWASAYGQRPDMAAQLGIHNIATAVPEIPYDPLSSARLNLPPTVPAVPSLDDIPGVTVAADPNNITLPTEPTGTPPPAQVDAEQAPTIDPDVAAANMPVRPQQPIVKAAAAAAAPTRTAEEEKKRNSFLSRLLPSGGSIFGIGPNGFFSNAGSFTPFAGAGGSSPFNMQRNGTMGTTNWRQGSVTGNPAMSGVMWNRSGNNGSVGYVTDPVTGTDHPIYTGSPNRL